MHFEPGSTHYQALPKKMRNIPLWVERRCIAMRHSKTRPQPPADVQPPRPQESPDQPHRPARYSRDDVCRALQNLIARHGEGVTLDEFIRETGISITPICRLFGNWSGLRQAVGLSPRGQKASPAVSTHEQLREKLLEAVQVYGETITLEQYLTAAGISATPIYHLFGSWTALQESVGLRPRRLSTRLARNCPRQMLRQVDEVMQHPDPPVTLKELISRTGLTRRQVEAEFGSWDELLEMAFVETRNGRLERLTDDELDRLYEWTRTIFERVLKSDGERWASAP
jgi:AraC-like DNA-binding protein